MFVVRETVVIKRGLKAVQMLALLRVFPVVQAPLVPSIWCQCCQHGTSATREAPVPVIMH